MKLKKIKTPKCNKCNTVLKNDGRYYCNKECCEWEPGPMAIGHQRWLCPKCYNSYYEEKEE